MQTSRGAQHRDKSIFIIALFMTVFASVLLVFRPVNTFDYGVYVEAMHAATSQGNPYLVDAFLLPPWSVPVLLVLTLLPVRAWLALNVALFVSMVFDVGKPSGLLLMVTPIFVTLMVTANPEWLLVGPGLWLIYRAPRGWLRGVAWVILSTKMAALLFLVVDGWQALRQRDWRAISLAAVCAAISLIVYPQFFAAIVDPARFPIHSLTAIARFGIAGAVLMTIVIVALRWRRLGDGTPAGAGVGAQYVPVSLDGRAVHDAPLRLADQCAVRGAEHWSRRADLV